MPNWCENILNVSGPIKQVQEMIEQSWAMLDEVLCPDFDKIIPYPQKYKEQDAKAGEEVKKLNAMPEEERLKAIIERGWPKDGFNNGGKEWCWDNWGTIAPFAWGLFSMAVIQAIAGLAHPIPLPS